MMKHPRPSILLGLGVVMVAVPFILGRILASSPVRKAPALPSGSEAPIPGEAYANGFNIPSSAPCNFADSYAGAHDLTGPPIAPFTGRSQDFLYVRLLCAPLDPSKPVVYANLGLEALRRSGLLPDPGAKAHPLVAQYFQDSRATGLDPSFYGRILSKPICKGATCRQYTDRTLLLINQTTKVVRWAPLGCFLNAGCARFQVESQQPPFSQSLPGLLITCIGAFLALAGLVTLAKHFIGSAAGERFYG